MAADRAPARHALALFDFDGTLTTAETFGPFVRAAAPRGRVRVGGVLLAPLVLAYRAGLVSGSTVRAAIVRVAFAGVPAADVAAHGEAFARDVIPGLLRPSAVASLDRHRERGDTVAVVSGAFDAYLAPWCAAQGIELFASSLASRDGVLTGRYRGAQCVGEEKARRVRAAFALAEYAEVHAYGDTAEDEALLALAQHRTYRGRPQGATAGRR
ncbi:MAG: HAD-IB family hydrolase [Pseudomonas sp.]|nr:HAD-IB family hydrolase [Pseudomonas sp.]